MVLIARGYFALLQGGRMVMQCHSQMSNFIDKANRRMREPGGPIPAFITGLLLSNMPWIVVVCTLISLG